MHLPGSISTTEHDISSSPSLAQHHRGYCYLLWQTSMQLQDVLHLLLTKSCLALRGMHTLLMRLIYLSQVFFGGNRAGWIFFFFANDWGKEYRP